MYIRVDYSYNSNWCTDVFKVAEYLEFDYIKEKVKKELEKEYGLIKDIKVRVYNIKEL